MRAARPPEGARPLQGGAAAHAVRKAGGRQHTSVAPLVRQWTAILTMLVAGVGIAHADSLAVMQPLGLGPYPVGCSNVAQDFTRLAPGDDVQTYWEGVPRNGNGRYITDLL